MRRLFVILTLVLFGSALLTPPTSTAAPHTASYGGLAYRYFPETRHIISGEFKRFYDANGGLETYGMPLTEVFTENAAQIQYFEYARFEIPSNPAGRGVVSLALLGSDLAVGRDAEPAFQWLGASPSPDRTFFGESGHTIGGAFAWFWNNRGGVQAFGFPVSEELTEASPVDGAPTLTQYFQRARFELRQNEAGEYIVTRLPLGRRSLETRPDVVALTAGVPPMMLLGSASSRFNGSSYERRTNIQRASALFNGVVVQPGQVHSFAAASDFSASAGFVEGYGIVGDTVEKVIGGGLCQVSTMMFRAVSNAGLQIVDRTGHSHVVYFYEDFPGFDATVSTPEIDFKWRNDSKSPVLIVSDVDMARSVVTFELYGTSDGRSVTYAGPNIRNRTKPGTPLWKFDPTLKNGERKQLVHGRGGMDVNYIRTVVRGGQQIGRDDFYTHYDPWVDFYLFGPGVTPPAGVRVIR